MITKTTRPRGRPRRFDPGEAVATAERLFHARGYDAVGVTDVTEALGINPPSFYAAFGSKLGLYARALDRYAGGSGALPLGDLLRPDRPVAACLAALLEEAARRYAADSEASGCMVVEGTRGNDAEARAAACAYNIAAEELIRDYVAIRHPGDAERVTDFVTTTLFGLSAKARGGHDLARLLATARLAGSAIAVDLSKEPSRDSLSSNRDADAQGKPAS